MSSPIFIVDYQMGNLRSVQKAIERVGGEARITSDPADVATAQKLILPGVGAFRDAMIELESRGLVSALRDYATRERPFMGICLGMQLLFDRSSEGGDHEGLGIIPGEVVRFDLSNDWKVPHMGWNTVQIGTESDAGSPTNFVSDLGVDPYFYFLHSYYAKPNDIRDVWLRSEYGGIDFCAAVHRGSIFATQFHPEKSQGNGLKLLERFVAY